MSADPLLSLMSFILTCNLPQILCSKSHVTMGQFLVFYVHALGHDNINMQNKEAAIKCMQDIAEIVKIPC